MTSERQNHTDSSTPAARIIARFGAKQLAAWCGRHPSRVYAWTWPPERNGTGGVIPIRLRRRIIEGARRDLAEILTGADFEAREGETYSFDRAA